MSNAELSTEQWKEWKSKLDEWLSPDGPIAIAGVQHLEPALGKDSVIFPPTYPMPVLRGRMHTVKDGEYRVSVELPPFRDAAGKSNDKGEQKSQKEPGYNIDYFRDGSNICEIDSPQSQANHMEPQFKVLCNGRLVPQVRINVKGEMVNLLDAGHRAADAVVCFSSLCAEFNEAFADAAKGNLCKLAKLSPTSLLFGAWDSRGTQAKLARIIKAQIRATDVEVLTRSAQFVPAADFIQSGAIDEELNREGEDKNPLSAEGFNAVPAMRMHGGVIIKGKIKREVLINLAALRDISAIEESTDQGTRKIQKHDHSQELRRYLLALALVCLSRPPSSNLREGCLLRVRSPKQNKLHLIPFEGEDQPFDPIPAVDAELIALAAAREFFGNDFDGKDRLDAVFESGVANEYLRMDKSDREKLRRAGPITQKAIAAHKAKQASDPFKEVTDILKGLKKSLPKSTGRKQTPAEIVSGFFDDAIVALERVSMDDQCEELARTEAHLLAELLRSDKGTKSTYDEVLKRIKAFGEKRKAVATDDARDTPAVDQPA